MTRSVVGLDTPMLGQLIERLGPLNNRWRDDKRPAEKVLALWDMGDVLLNVAPQASDALLWAVQERSYITRTLLRYALILRRSWTARSDLAQLVDGLHSYAVFREALPFLKNDRKGIDSQTYEAVVRALRSPNTRSSTRFLKELKGREIGRQHSKGVSAEAMREQASRFVRALSQLEMTATTARPHDDAITPVTLMALSQVAMAVATDETVAQVPAALQRDAPSLPDLAEPLIAAVRGGRSTQSAFRKTVGHERLMLAADLLHSLRSDETLAEWRRRRSAQRATLGQ